MRYLDQGNVKLAVRFHQGKEAIVTILDADEFFGEECLAGQRCASRRLSPWGIALITGKFRTLGFIDYTQNGALTVNSHLLSVILSD